MELFLQYKNAASEEEKEKIREQIFPIYKNLIYKYIRRSLPREFKLEFDDVVNACVIEFCKALERFQPEKDFKFSTYLYFYIMKGMWDYCYFNNPVHVPRNHFRGGKKSAEFQNVDISHTFASNIVWLDKEERVGLPKGETYDSVFKWDKNQLNPEEIYYKNKDRELLLKTMGNFLTARQSDFVKRYYYGEFQKIEEIAKDMNEDKKMVARLSYEAKGKIKKHAKRIKNLMESY